MLPTPIIDDNNQGLSTARYILECEKVFASQMTGFDKGVECTIKELNFLNTAEMGVGRYGDHVGTQLLGSVLKVQICNAGEIAVFQVMRGMVEEVKIPKIALRKIAYGNKKMEEIYKLELSRCRVVGVDIMDRIVSVHYEEFLATYTMYGPDGTAQGNLVTGFNFTTGKASDG